MLSFKKKNGYWRKPVIPAIIPTRLVLIQAQILSEKPGGLSVESSTPSVHSLDAPPLPVL